MAQVTYSPLSSTHPLITTTNTKKTPPGTLQCPGGHLEHGESFAATAAREVLEETGLEVGNIKFLTATNDVFPDAEGAKHYVTVFVTCTIVGEDKVAKPMEPHKCAAWHWIPWHQMWAWAGEQAEAEKAGRPTTGRVLFLPLVNLWREYPELRHVLGGGQVVGS
ncbi:hypothetical protein ACJQWK_01144 [Exserohilum turcicum]